MEKFYIALALFFLSLRRFKYSLLHQPDHILRRYQVYNRCLNDGGITLSGKTQKPWLKLSLSHGFLYAPTPPSAFLKIRIDS